MPGESTNFRTSLVGNAQELPHGWLQESRRDARAALPSVRAISYDRSKLLWWVSSRIPRKQAAMTSQFPLVWNLDGRLAHPSSPEFRQAIEQAEQRLAGLATDSRLLPAPVAEEACWSAWSHFVERWMQAEEVFTDLNAFISCHAAADAENILYQQYEARLACLVPFREEMATNVEFLLRDLTDKALTAWCSAHPVLADLTYFFKLRRRNARLRLPREQELLAADLAVDGLHAWGRLYDRLSGRLKVTVLEKGKLVEKSPGQVTFDSPERTIREQRFLAADAAWASISVPCAEALNHIAGTRLTTYRRIGLADHLEAPLNSNRMSRQTLETMWQCISDRKPVLLNYFSRKAQLIGVKQLSWFDQSAPLPALPGLEEEKLPYDEACRLIIASFEQFDPEFGAFAKLALTEGWVEAENRAGKRQGGFCTHLPGWEQSRIFMTYVDVADSMSTLAHELGHAYHSWVLREAPVVLQDYPMNLAETASTFAEAVLGEQRLRQATSDYARLHLLDGMLGDAVAFLMNIHARFLFEEDFHHERRNGEVSADRLNELMVAAQKQAYLDAFAEEGWNSHFWISKLHFYITGLPYYNFPYTFGYLLSLGLYAIGQELGPQFPAAYKNFLVATGSKDAEDAVNEAFGYDLREPKFWNRSLDIIEQRVQQFCDLADQFTNRLKTV